MAVPVTLGRQNSIGRPGDFGGSLLIKPVVLYSGPISSRKGWWAWFKRTVQAHPPRNVRDIVLPAKPDECISFT